MLGDYDTIKVVNGKGIFSQRTRAVGMQNWGGLISMKTETGTKTYPFKGSYLVANKTAVVSPVNRIFYILKLIIHCNCPGFSAGEISATITNGSISAVKKSSAKT